MTGGSFTTGTLKKDWKTVAKGTTRESGEERQNKLVPCAGGNGPIGRWLISRTPWPELSTVCERIYLEADHVIARAPLR